MMHCCGKRKTALIIIIDMVASSRTIERTRGRHYLARSGNENALLDKCSKIGPVPKYLHGIVQQGSSTSPLYAGP